MLLLSLKTKKKDKTRTEDEISESINREKAKNSTLLNMDMIKGQKEVKASSSRKGGRKRTRRVQQLCGQGREVSKRN